MSMIEMERKAHELKELKRMQEELTDEITALEDALKAAMGDSEQINAGAYKISWKPVTSARIDTSAFRRAMPELAEKFTRTSTYKRFQIA